LTGLPGGRLNESVNGRPNGKCEPSLVECPQNGAISARYEYDPFGNTVFAAGAYAYENPFRFSTKYFDYETGLYYYG